MAMFTATVISVIIVRRERQKMINIRSNGSEQLNALENYAVLTMRLFVVMPIDRLGLFASSVDLMIGRLLSL